MINYLAVIVAAIAAMIIGSIWWGPLFGKIWIEENGLNKLSHEEQEKMKKGMAWLYVQQAVLSFVQAWVIAYILTKVGSGVQNGLLYGFLLWLGFLFPTEYGGKLWGTKPWKLILAQFAASLITLLAMGLILGTWQA